MSYSFSAKEARICQKIKNFIYKYSAVSLRTNSSLLGRIGCPEKRWQLQRLVKVIEYFTTSSDCFEMSHCFGRQSGGILCTFISEGRMFPMLERLDPTAHKGEDHVISGNSLVFHLCNDSNEALDLLVTRSHTRPVFLDLRGARNSFWKWGFKVLDMKPEFLPLESFTRWIIR